MNGFITKNPIYQQRLYIINRSGSGDASFLLLTPDRSEIKNYQIKTDHWSASTGISNFGVAVHKNFLYIIGGFDINKAVAIRKVSRYDPLSGVWVDRTPLVAARQKFTVSVFENKIFVIGGEGDDGKVLSSSEIYKPEEDIWEEGPKLISPRSNLCSVVYQNEIYCAGGCYGGKCHKSFWVFEKNKWKELDRDYPQRLPHSLDRFCFVSHGRNLYFIGGVSSKMEKASSKYRFMTERRMHSYTTSVSALSRTEHGTDIVGEMISPWHNQLPAMTYGRHSAGAIVIGDRIYVFGGSLMETGQAVRIVEYYSISRGQWQEDFRFRKDHGDVSNVTCAILEVPTKLEEENLNEKLRWVMW